jgi:hypothetical protein
MWIADLILAVLLPYVVLPALGGIELGDPYENPYFLAIDPIWCAAVAGSFVVAAAWSYRRPSQALEAQLVPAAALALAAGVVIWLFATLPDA